MKKLLLSSAVLLALSISPSANAACDGCVVSAVNGARATLSANLMALNASVTAQTTAIVAAISGSTSTLATQQARAAEMQVQGNQRTNSTMEMNRQEDRYIVADGCNVMANSRGTADAARAGGGGGVGRGGGGSGATGVSGDMQRAISISAGRESAPSPEVQAALAVPGACSSFVSSAADPLRAQTCTLAGYSASASNGNPNADIRAETLFDGPQRSTDPARLVRRLTIDGDGPDASAVMAYLRNLNTPVDLRALKRAELQTDEGRQYMLYRDAYEARMSLAEKPARVMNANMTANRLLSPVVEQMLESPVTGPFVRNYLNKNYPRWQARGISMAELTNLEAERRYMNADWHIQMASLPPEAHVKEQTTMMALNTVLLTRILERLEQGNVIAGQASATQVRAEMMPQLIQLHSAASK
jgi:hypothetical protein